MNRMLEHFIVQVLRPNDVKPRKAPVSRSGLIAS